MDSINSTITNAADSGSKTVTDVPTRRDVIIPPYISIMSLDNMNSRPDRAFEGKSSEAYRRHYRALAQKEAQELTDKLLASRLSKREGKRMFRQEQRGLIISESANADMTVGDSTVQPKMEENVQDYTGDASQTMKLGVPLHDTPDGGETQFNLDKFFERPVLIHDSVFNSATEYDLRFKIWDLWSKDPSVRAKLANYSYFKGNLHVRIATTGTPYHYGRIMASYQPYAGFNATLEGYDRAFAVANTMLPSYKVYLSQAPGVGYIDVKLNDPLELDVPFLSSKAKHRLFNSASTVITNATSYDDFEEAGELRIVTLNTLNVANSDYDSDVSFNIYVWATDIELGTITGTNVNITAQARQRSRKSGGNNNNNTNSRKHAENAAKEIRRKAEDLEDELSSDEEDAGAWSKYTKDKPMYSGEGSVGTRFMKSLEKGGDEYAEPGPVSVVASAVAGAGEAFSNVPVIGSFAKATSTVAKSIGKVASWFGWSRPVVLEDHCYVKQTPYANGAFTSGKETTYKLTCDPKQELSVDQSLGGSTEDEMTIAHIAGRESFITTFTWADTDLAGSNLWQGLVTPTYWNAGTYGVGSTQLFQDTPMSFAAVPFSYWRGSIKFRFEIVCSKFHRGKLLFKFEPNIAQNALISADGTKLNQQNTIIVDLQDTQDVEFTVDWAHVRNWATLNNQKFIVSPSYDMGATATDFAINNSSANGFVEVRPLNELVQPTTLATVPINVYVSCPDLQLARPTEDNMPDDRTILAESADLGSINANSAKVDSKLFLDHFGESVVSFRSLMKRYVYTVGGTIAPTVTNTNTSVNITVNNYPRNDLSILNTTSVSDGNPHHLFNYLRHAYMGVRGGMRHRTRFYSTSDISGSGYVVVSSKAPAFLSCAQAQIAGTTSLVSPVFLSPQDSHRTSLDGSVTFHLDTNGGVEYETPFYTDNLFLYAFSDRSFGAQDTWDDDMGFNGTMCFQTHLSAAIGSAVTKNIYVTEEVATGEDFTFLRFQGAPLTKGTSV